MKHLETEYNVTIRKATVTDFKTWAYATIIKRAHIGDYVFELVANGQVTVYILINLKAGTNQVIGVCEKPSQELLEAIDSSKE